MPRGFASMTPERRRELGAQGGRKSTGNFKHNPERAKAAGRKGGLANKKFEIGFDLEKTESEPK